MRLKVKAHVDTSVTRRINWTQIRLKRVQLLFLQRRSSQISNLLTRL